MHKKGLRWLWLFDESAAKSFWRLNESSAERDKPTAYGFWLQFITPNNPVCTIGHSRRINNIFVCTVIATLSVSKGKSRRSRGPFFFAPVSHHSCIFMVKLLPLIQYLLLLKFPENCKENGRSSATLTRTTKAKNL